MREVRWCFLCGGPCRANAVRLANALADLEEGVRGNLPSVPPRVVPAVVLEDDEV